MSAEAIHLLGLPKKHLMAHISDLAAELQNYLLIDGSRAMDFGDGAGYEFGKKSAFGTHLPQIKALSTLGNYGMLVGSLFLYDETADQPTIYLYDKTFTHYGLIHLDASRNLRIDASSGLILPQKDVKFVSSTTGILLRDRSVPANYYRLFVDNGVLDIELV